MTNRFKMIHKIITAGRGGDTVEYLMAAAHRASAPRVLRGSPELLSDLISQQTCRSPSLTVCLSFSENHVSASARDTIIDHYESVLLAGLDPEAIANTWIEHNDKQRLEINGVFINRDLALGRSITLYWDRSLTDSISSRQSGKRISDGRSDRRLFQLWTEHTNRRFGLSSPYALSRMRCFSVPPRLPVPVKNGHLVLGNYIQSLALAGQILDRDDVVRALNQRSQDCRVEHVGEHNVQVLFCDTDGGGENHRLRLCGPAYREDFQGGRRETWRRSWPGKLSDSEIASELAQRVDVRRARFAAWRKAAIAAAARRVAKCATAIPRTMITTTAMDTRTAMTIALDNLFVGSPAFDHEAPADRLATVTSQLNSSERAMFRRFGEFIQRSVERVQGELMSLARRVVARRQKRLNQALARVNLHATDAAMSLLRDMIVRETTRMQTQAAVPDQAGESTSVASPAGIGQIHDSFHSNDSGEPAVTLSTQRRRSNSIQDNGHRRLSGPAHADSTRSCLSDPTTHEEARPKRALSSGRRPN